MKPDSVSGNYIFYFLKTIRKYLQVSHPTANQCVLRYKENVRAKNSQGQIIKKDNRKLGTRDLLGGTGSH